MSIKKTVLPVLLTLFCLSGCSSSYQQTTGAASSVASSEAVAPVAADDAYSKEEAVADTEAPAQGDSGAGFDFVQESNAKRVYTANVTIQTQEYQESYQKIVDLLHECNGFIQDESTSGRGDETHYTSFTLRVPTTKFDSFINQLSQAGNITYTSKSAENITKRYYDTAGRIESLEKERDKLNEMMEKAENVSDLIEIEDRLVWVEHDLKSLQMDLSQMDLDVEYSTIYVDLLEVRVYTNESRSIWSRMGSAMKDTWIYFGDNLGELCINLIYALPWLLFFGLLIWGIVALIRKTRTYLAGRKTRPVSGKGKKKEKRNQKMEASPMENQLSTSPDSQKDLEEPLEEDWK